MVLTSQQLRAAQWTLIVWTLLMVLARLYVRVYHQGKGIFNPRSWRWADVLVVLAWLNVCGIGIMDTVTTSWDFPNPAIHYTSYQIMTIRKMSYSEAALIWLTVYFVKASMLCFFGEWIPKVLIRQWWAVRIIGFVVFLCATAVFLLWLTNPGCGPVSEYWDPDKGSCWNPHGNIQFAYAAQLSTDLMVLAIPFTVFPLLSGLDTRQKIGTGIMFALGLCSTACTATVAYTVMIPVQGEELLSTSWMAILFESGTAITMACIPSFKAFLTTRELRKFRGRRGMTETVEVARTVRGSSDDENKEVLQMVAEETSVSENGRSNSV